MCNAVARWHISNVSLAYVLLNFDVISIKILYKMLSVILRPHKSCLYLKLNMQQTLIQYLQQPKRVREKLNMFVRIGHRDCKHQCVVYSVA